MKNTKNKISAVVLLMALLAFCVSCGADTKAEPVSIEVNSNEENIPSAMSEWNNNTTPTTGNLDIPIFLVDFPDAKFGETDATGSSLEKFMFSADIPGSVTSFYNTASYNQLNITGHVYNYTAVKNVADYENDNGFEDLSMEVLTTFDDLINYKDCDANNDGVIDAYVLVIAEGGDADFWYGCQATWYQNPDFKVDGVRPLYYVMCDAQPDLNNMDYFYEVVCHELGHCMGLPDYYKYNTTDDWEGMKGIAGSELMDEMEGDLSQFSKLQLGWLKPSQVQIYHIGEDKDFKLLSSEYGGCIVVFPTESEDFQSEYFVIEYDTASGNYKNLLSKNDAGVRIIHVQAEDEFDGFNYYYKYNNYSDSYETDDNGIRVVRLVNNDNGYFKANDVASYGDDGFSWYEYEPTSSLKIKIDNIDDDYAYISITS